MRERERERERERDVVIINIEDDYSWTYLNLGFFCFVGAGYTGETKVFLPSGRRKIFFFGYAWNILSYLQCARIKKKETYACTVNKSHRTF